MTKHSGYLRMQNTADTYGCTTSALLISKCILMMMVRIDFITGTRQEKRRNKSIKLDKNNPSTLKLD